MPFYQIRPDRRPPGWQILTLAGIPYYVEPSFLFLLGILMINDLQQGVQFVQVALFGFAIFFSLLIHETGHALMARLFGFRDIVVSLALFGGMTSHPRATRGRNLLITLAGPLCTAAVTALILLLFYMAPGLIDHEGIRFFLRQAFIINIVWLIFNLLPIYPLDGGQSVFYALSYVISERRAMLFIAVISVALCAAGGLWALKRKEIFLFLILLMLGLQNIQIIRSIKTHA